MTSLLPDVTLSGTTDAIVVHNNTKKTIIACVMHVGNAAGGGETRTELPFLAMRNGRGLAIPAGGQFQLKQSKQEIRAIGQTITPQNVSATLAAVMFADGEVVGHDPEADNLLNAATDRINAERYIHGKLLAAATEATGRSLSKSSVARRASSQDTHRSMSITRNPVLGSCSPYAVPHLEGRPLRLRWSRRLQG